MITLLKQEEFPVAYLYIRHVSSCVLSTVVKATHSNRKGRIHLEDPLSFVKKFVNWLDINVWRLNSHDQFRYQGYKNYYAGSKWKKIFAVEGYVTLGYFK